MARKKTELVQIQKSPIPPLHQSTRIMTACPKFYVTAVIQGRKKPGSQQASRGTQVHRVMAQYASHCARKGISMDLEAFDFFAKGVGPSAGKILAGMRESYNVDFAHLFATEITMALDENMQPTDVCGPLEGTTDDSGLPPHYEGTLDALYMFREGSSITIDDAKTHARPFDPKDPEFALQSQMYSVFAFQFFPWVESVKFRLWFVRYKNLTRDVEYTRQDLPSLIDAVKTARSLQLSIHATHDAGGKIEAIGNDGCFYCPLLSGRECPILQDNPNAQGEPSEWVSTEIVYSAYAKVNRARMKAWIQANGRPIILRDFNQKCYSYGPTPSEGSIYPLFQATAESVATRCMKCFELFAYIPADGQCPKCHGMVRPIMPIVDKLEEYAHGNPDDTNWYSRLVISSTELNSKLSAKKRAFLDQSIQDAADKVTRVRVKVSKPQDSIVEEPEENEEWDEEGEDF